MQAKEGLPVSQAMNRFTDQVGNLRKRTAFQTRLPVEGRGSLSPKWPTTLECTLLLVYRSQVHARWDGMAVPPSPPTAHGSDHDIYHGGGRRAQGSSRSLTSVLEWLVVSRISQTQSRAIPAVRKSNGSALRPADLLLGRQGPRSLGARLRCCTRR